MGGITDSVKNVVSGVTGGLVGGGADIPKPPKIEPPKPVAPATQQSANVQQAGQSERRRLANQSGRSSQNLLDVEEANIDKEKDILG